VRENHFIKINSYVCSRLCGYVGNPQAGSGQAPALTGLSIYPQSKRVIALDMIWLHLNIFMINSRSN
jgi:hypothetical protein